MPTTEILANISIILVDTKSPANIGSTARCMMNMGVSSLVLVNPPDDPDSEAEKLSAGAFEIVQKARIAFSLQEAVADHQFIFATSRHDGKLRRNITPPREAAKKAAALLTNNKVAIVFGNEVNGLEQEHLALCQEIVAIPSSDTFPSLNLSHAVMVVLYELFLASRADITPTQRPLATSNDRVLLYEHLQRTLLHLEFLDEDRSARMMFTFRQLFDRARLDEREVNVLRGVLTAIDAACKNKSAP